MINTRSRLPKASVRVFFVFTTLAIVIALFYSSSSASRDKKNRFEPRSARSVRASAKSVPAIVPPAKLLSSKHLMTPLVQAGNESVATFAADCSTPKVTFQLGETVCAKATNAPLSLFPRRISFINPVGFIESSTDVLTDPQSTLFQIPNTETSVVNGVVVDNRGKWRANLARSNGSVRESATFTVQEANNPSANLGLDAFVLGGTASVTAGGNISVVVVLTNDGPDAADAVQLADSAPTGTQLLSLTQRSGPSFSCTGGDCTIAQVDADATAEFLAVYQIDASVPGRTILQTSTTVSSTTPGPNNQNRSASAKFEVDNPNVTATCLLDCPDNITTSATTTQNGVAGAFVTFSAEPFGDCGEVNASPASGTFFPVGTTIVSATSSVGSGSCTFTVTVIDTAAPTISCPPNQTVTAPANSSEATVDPGTPSTTSSSAATVVGVRNDGLQLTDPYPVGLTQITWTVTDSSNRSAHCVQDIRVNDNACGVDNIPPTITAPPNVTVSTGPDNPGCVVALSGELGQPTADDNCSVSVSVSGIPAGNAFPIGTTTITYTATDGAGNTATGTQRVTVNDDTPPIIVALADASYVCPSEIPPASPSQAHGADQNLPDGGPPTDNCGAPTVTVTQASSGAGSASSPLVILRTFTATDASGNSSSAVQTITVIDNVPPAITAPANATYQCASQVPAANASQATASDNCATPTVTVHQSDNGGLGSSANPLIITRTFTATDSAGNTVSASQVITVIDTTPPSVTAPAPTTGSADNSCMSPIPNVLPGVTASDNCSSGGSITLTQSPAAGTLVTLGSHTITVTATDAAGNSNTANTSFNVVDTLAPVLSCPADVVVNLPLNSTATSMVVNYAAATATDNCSTTSVSITPASGSVFPVGTTTVTATATDAAGNSSTCSFTVTVLYNFTGFFSPVSNLPVINNVNAGRAIPVKFSLSGNKGLNIFAAGSPYTVAIECDGTNPGSDIIETVNAGSSYLSYSPDQYNYVWRTDEGWAGTCRQLVIKLNDGSTHKANFRFR